MSLLVPLGFGIGGGVINRLISGKMKGPIDTTGVERAKFDRGRIMLNNEMDRNLDRELAMSAQTGQTSSAATSNRQEMFQNHTSTMADWEAMVADSLARSKADHLQSQRDFRNQKVANRLQSFDNLLGGVINYDMQQRLDGDGPTDLEQGWSTIKNKIKNWF